MIDNIKPPEKYITQVLKYTECFPNFYIWIIFIIGIVCCIFALRIYFINKENVENSKEKKRKIKKCIIFYFIIILLISISICILSSLNIEVEKSLYSSDSIIESNNLLFFCGINSIMVVCIIILSITELVIDKRLRKRCNNNA